MRYDPHRHAEHLGIRVEYVPNLADLGRWYPNRGTIHLRAGLPRHEERSTLAHELGHAALGHVTSSPRNELAADKWAARRLIDPGALADAAATSDDPAQWCRDLDVSPRHLLIYLSLMEEPCSTPSPP